MVKTAKVLDMIVVTRACAESPPAAAVITTPLLSVEGITATRKSPMRTPLSTGINVNARATSGAAMKVTPKVRSIPLTSIRPFFNCPWLREKPESRKIVTTTTSGP